MFKFWGAAKAILNIIFSTPKCVIFVYLDIIFIRTLFKHMIKFSINLFYPKYFKPLNKCTL